MVHMRGVTSDCVFLFKSSLALFGLDAIGIRTNIFKSPGHGSASLFVTQDDRLDFHLFFHLGRNSCHEFLSGHSCPLRIYDLM